MSNIVEVITDLTNTASTAANAIGGMDMANYALELILACGEVIKEDEDASIEAKKYATQTLLFMAIELKKKVEEIDPEK